MNKLEKIVEKGHDPITPIAAKLMQKSHDSHDSSPIPDDISTNKSTIGSISGAKKRWNKAKIVGKIGVMANKVIKSKVKLEKFKARVLSSKPLRTIIVFTTNSSCRLYP